MTAIGLRALLEPSSIAIAGLSADPAKHGARVLRALRALGYRGEVWGVNPGLPDIDGIEVVARISDLPITPDLVVAAVPGGAAAELIAECEGVGAVVLFAAGFAETGPEGSARQAELAAIADSVGTRLLGPNSGGVIRPGIGLAASFLTCLERPAGEIKSGPVAVVTQSGGIGSYLHNLAASLGQGLAVSVSTGNEADIKIGEAIEAVSRLDEVEVVVAVVESIRDGTRFIAAMRSSYVHGKRVVACRLGRSLVGQRLMESHTGALAVPDAIVIGIFETVGITVADTPGEAYEVAMIMARRPPVPGGKVGIVTHSGGTALLVADLAARAGIALDPPGPALTAAIEPSLDHGSAANPTDLGGIIGQEGRFGEAVREFTGSSDFDIVLAVTTAHPPTHTASRVDSLIELGARAPVVHLWMAGDQGAEGLGRLRSAGMAVTENPQAAIRALAGLIRDVDQSPLPQPITGPPQEWDIPSHEGIVVEALGEANVAAESLGYPVVVKLEGSGPTHKTDIGGVILDVRDPEELERACRSIQDVGTGLGLRAVAFRVQRFRPGLEVIVGAIRHESFGPLVSVGFGGTLAEIVEDVAIAPAPVTTATAHAMIDRLQMERLLLGYRGMPSADVSGLARIISQVSRGIAGGGVEEFEINPLIWDGEQWIAVDWFSR